MVGDIAVLGSPDNQEFSEQARAYEQLLDSIVPMAIADAPNKGSGWILSLDGQWFRCDVMHRDGPLWIFDATQGIQGGMSGSPIIDDNCEAIGVVCAGGGTTKVHTGGGPNPRLVYNLPGWLLQELRL